MKVDRLESVQALRGFAATIVVGMHCVAMASAYSGNPIMRSAFEVPAQLGHFGVDIFFVLSGVLISTMVAPPNGGKPPSALGFAVRRAARIYPLFWITLAVMLVLPPPPGADNSLATLLRHPLSLVLLESPQAQPVGWTLVFEIHFYLVTTAALLFGRLAWIAALMWIPIQIAVVSLSSVQVLPKYAFFDPISLELCGGLIVGLCVARKPLPYPGLFLALALAASAAVALLLPLITLVNDGGSRLLLLGLPAAMLVYAAISLETKGRRPPKWLTFQGDVSYSIYMWHVPVLAAMVVLLRPILPTFSGALLYATVSLICCIRLSWASFAIIERPINRWAKRLMSGREAGGSRAPGPSRLRATNIEPPLK